jgi:hexosaminidase
VPEIEMPGHSRSALAAYPDLACTAGPFKVATYFGIFSDILYPGKESVFTFLEDVLDEVLDIFPSTLYTLAVVKHQKSTYGNAPNASGASGKKD